ncbi:MAG: carboxypeptidase-like regulatory domain-containing protein [Planctomycetota bacterium]|jgi:hypothetical protein
MAVLLCLLLLTAPGTIRVRVEGDATEVVALVEGVVRHRAALVRGRAVLEGLPGGAYDLQARGPQAASPIERGVRAIDDDAPGTDAVLVAHPTFPVTIATEPGATVWCEGAAYPADAVRLPAGLHLLVVDHPERVSSAGRLVRVAGPVTLRVTLDPGLAVAGRVTDAAGQPAVGREVEAFADGYPTGRRTRTDDAGGFHLNGFRGNEVSLLVRRDGGIEAHHRLVFYPGEERTRVRIALHPRSGVRLEVVDARGARLPRAEGVLLPEWYEEVLEEPRLRANHAPVRRGGGVLSFEVTPGRRYRVLVTAPAHRPVSTATFVAPPAGETLALPRLAPGAGAALHGRIRLADRTPAGMVVVCQGPEGTATCRADRAGRFRFGALDPGEHILWVRGVDETGVRVTLEAGAHERIELGCRFEERVITGRVLDGADQPLAGVEVEAAGRRATTGEDGSFRLADLPRGPPRFVLRFRPGPGCRGLVADPHLPHVERKVGVGTAARVRLVRAGRLWLRFDPGERPLARARLLIASATTGLKLERKLPYRAREIVVEDLPVGPYRVEVAAPGLLGTVGAVVQAAREAKEPTTVVVAPGRTARGRVVLRRAVPRPGVASVVTDLALDRGWVALLDADALRALAHTPVEADGAFVLQGLPAAPVILCASAPGLPVTSVRVDLTRADADGVRITLQDGVEAAVVVTGEEGEPLPQARVRVLDERGVDIRDLAAHGRFRGVVAGEEDLDDVRRLFRLERGPGGRVAASFLQPGSYRFHVSADGHESVRVGVRARSAWVLEGIRRNLKEHFKEAFPGGPPDLASPVRLVRAKD